MKSRSPGFIPGDYWFTCDRCGVAHRKSEGRLTWDGLFVDLKCWEPRHPQDFVRGVADIIAPGGPSRSDNDGEDVSITYGDTSAPHHQLPDGV